MRLIIRHTIAFLIFCFVVRFAIQAQGHTLEVSLPKAVLLSRLADNDPIPSHGFGRQQLLKAIETDSSRLVNSQASGNYR